MREISLFSDISLNPQLRVGFGAYLILFEATQISQEEIKVRKFETSSSAELEILNLLWAMGELEESKPMIDLFRNITIFTDSQCVDGLLHRRENLEKKCFIGSGSKKELKNSENYKKFYSLFDRLEFEIVKVKGHSSASKKDLIQKCFSSVDKASRKALRSFLETGILK
ncbi:MAG: ribonuclease H [Candidatus Riflebacteria bacterium]|nr:ribonuclease H [Candidatus Riflebacteria bacterium]